jgi:hypothetical protein
MNLNQHINYNGTQWNIKGNAKACRVMDLDSIGGDMKIKTIPHPHVT